MKRTISIFAFLLAISCAPAMGGSVVGDIVKGATGGAVDIDRGEVCAINQCIDNKGNTRTKSLGETVNDQLGQVPGYQLLSDADKENVVGLAMTGGLILAITTTDPITGAIIISILNGGQKQEVPVPSYNPDPLPTGEVHTLEAACIAKRGNSSFTAAFSESSPELLSVRRGDTVNLSAPFCATIEGSVTSVVITATSEATEVKNNPLYKYILLGETKS